MAKLILHIGSHKTGTTSLQTALRNAAPDLAQRGITVFDRKDLTPPVVGTSGEGAGFVARLRRNVADRLFRPRSPLTVFSSEGFFWLYDPEEVDALATLLRDRFESVEIYAYVRRQDEMVLSHRRQVLLGSPAQAFYGAKFLMLPEVEAHHHRLLDYHAKLAGLWGAHFGMSAIHAIPYARATLHNQDVVADFAHRTGLDLASPPEERNSGLTAAQIIAGFAVSEHGLPRRHLRRALFDMDHRPGCDTVKLLPSRERVAAFMAHFQDSNQRLAADFHCDGKPLAFDQSFDKYPPTEAPDWTSEEVFALLRSVLPMVAVPRAPEAARHDLAD